MIREVTELKQYLNQMKINRLGVPADVLQYGFEYVDEEVTEVLPVLNLEKYVHDDSGIIGVVIKKTNGKCIGTWLTGYKQFLGNKSLFTPGGEIAMKDVVNVYSIGLDYTDDLQRACGF